MTKPLSSSIMVAMANQTAILKIAGRASYTLSVDFKKLIHNLLEKGSRHFVFDLAQCTLMDSTFLGLLTGLSLKLEQNSSRPSESPVRLLNPNERIVSLLDNLGVSSHFQIDTEVSPEAVFAQITSSQASVVELAHASLEAHQTLMAIHPGNIPKFKDVAEFLAQDIAKLER